MTEARLRKIFNVWANRLRIERYDLELRLNEVPDNPYADASVWVNDDYEHAIVKFAPDWNDWTVEHANYIAAHELMHVVTNDLDATVRSITGYLSKDADDVFRDRYMHDLEATVDFMARRLLEIAGPA